MHMPKHKKKNLCNTPKQDRILDRLYQCRELEITTQWQRSVFLAAFIILLFTGYAKLIELLFCRNIACLPFHLTGLILAFLIFIFGILWLAMAKGSKRWTDIYETKIFLYEEKRRVNIPEQFKCKTERFCKNYNDKFSPSPPNALCCYKKGDLLEKKNSFWSFGSATVSTSKVNIMIGFIILIFGAIAVMLHAHILINRDFLHDFPEFCNLLLYAIVVAFSGGVGWKVWQLLKHVPYKAEQDHSRKDQGK